MSEKSTFNVCDIDSGRMQFIPKTKTIDDHRPFGITWHEDNLFIAQPTSILRFKMFSPLAYHAQSLWYGIHQILYYDNLLWTVSPRLNAIHRIKPDGTHHDFFFPNDSRVSPTLPAHFLNRSRLNYVEGDENHYNALFIKEDRLYLSAHNHDQSSFLAVYKYPELQPIQRYENMGKQIHNICVEGDEIWTLDSLGSRALVSTEGRSIPIGQDGQFVRGLAATEKNFILGCFPYDPKRHKRRRGDAWIVVVDRQKGREVKRITVRDMGNINDIRILDEPDLCHGIEPFKNKIYWTR